MTKVPDSEQRVKFYQTGTFTVGNRLLDDAQRSVQASVERANSLDSGTVPARAVAKRSVHATLSTPHCALPTTSSSQPTRRVVSKYSRHPIRNPPGACRGYTRCSATRPRSAPESRRLYAPGAARTCA